MVASVHDGALAPVYVLTAEGREYLAEETGDDAFLYKPIELPHPLQLFHAMAVVEFHITFDAAIATQTAVAVEVWINEGDVINADNPGPAQHYHAPAELCQQLRADADAAFLNQDLAAVHQALAVFQDVIIPLFHQAHPKRRTAAFRYVWWPMQSRCLLWKTQPETPCPDCGSRRFWRADARGFVGEACCPPLACEPAERFTLASETPNASPPGKLIWWHKNQSPPTWQLKEYASKDDPAPFPVQFRWPPLK